MGTTGYGTGESTFLESSNEHGPCVGFSFKREREFLTHPFFFFLIILKSFGSDPFYFEFEIINYIKMDSAVSKSRVMIPHPWFAEKQEHCILEPFSCVVLLILSDGSNHVYH